MALYEYHCTPCSKSFEQITSASDADAGKCPFCNGNETKRLISRFAVGGQGDLRESTMHGCHEYSGLAGGDGGGHDHSGHGHEGHGHSHGEGGGGHDHDD